MLKPGPGDVVRPVHLHAYSMCLDCEAVRSASALDEHSLRQLCSRVFSLYMGPDASSPVPIPQPIYARCIEGMKRPTPDLLIEAETEVASLKTCVLNM